MNHLASEKSPYLLQHANNPVDWYPWGEAAFEKARAERKPIFLSVGYSTCHWCHVMAHESFENEAIAKVLNDNFVPIKVDREERPDVDRVYMLFVQATTAAGGWPMSVWLTPELEPFYGGTYFPPTARWGRAGFIDILEEIARVWRDNADKVRRSAAQVTAQMQQFAASHRDGADTSGAGAASLAGRVGGEVLERAVAEFRRDFDPQHGGFGGAPKFPRPSELFFLLREFARRGDESARDMAVETLRAMARGGIHDHLGGGFHRYSVDARWHVPHFEKMLYDQAQLALAYLEAFQVTHDHDLADVAEGILRYVSRDLEHDGGGFFSAEDADSIPLHREPGSDSRLIPQHPIEGAFYVWTDAEVGEALGGAAHAARLRYGVRSAGNVESDPHGELAGKNVLYLARTVEDVAAAVERPADEVEELLEDARRRLFQARAVRPRPGLDDKVIVAWNGLMIAAFARAARVLRRDEHGEYLRSARGAAQFIRTRLWDEASGRLLRRYREGEAGIDAYADDYACLIFGLLELFQADGDPAWLRWALALQQRQDELFWDDADGGWFTTSGHDRSVLLRLKEDYDGAEPSASSVSVCNVLALERITGEEKWSSRVERTVAAFSRQLDQTPRAMPMMLAALSASLAPKQEIVIAGRAEETGPLWDALAACYLPFAVTIPLRPDNGPALAALLPFTEAMAPREGNGTAYVCRDFACSRPTSDAAEMLKEIGLPR